jgi:hypothetical protein
MASAGFATSLRDARSNKIKDAIDAGGGQGKLLVYGAAPSAGTTGIRPAVAGDPATNSSLFGTLLFANPCGTVSNGVLTLTPPSEEQSADFSGTAKWARVTDSAGTFVMDVDVTMAGQGGQFILNTTAIAAGGPIRCDTATITEGNTGA